MKYPGIIYDLSLNVPKEVLWSAIRDEVCQTTPLIKRVELFDVYNLSALSPDKKFLTFHLHFLDENKTLTVEEVDKLMTKIKNNLVKNLNILCPHVELNHNLSLRRAMYYPLYYEGCK